MPVRGRTAVIGATLVACGALAATALATVSSGGGTQIQMINSTSGAVASTALAPWVDVPTSGVVVNLPAPRVINARFTAESHCAGPQNGLCTARVVARPGTNCAAAAGAPIEFDPVVGVNFVFDSDVAGVTNDQWEGNAMERSKRLATGAYCIIVQYGVTNPGNTTFAVDDWHFAVEVSA